MGTESKQILLRLDVDLLEKLRHLHQKEGPMNSRSKKRRPFNVYLHSVLADYASERINSIKRMEAVKDWKGDEFDWVYQEVIIFSNFTRWIWTWIIISRLWISVAS